MTPQRPSDPNVALPMAPFMNQHKPWVSVICTCYNHAAYVRESLLSVSKQTYANVELIVIDNGSMDGSVAVIEAFCQQYPDTVFIPNPTNWGLCRAFNQGLAIAKGQFLIDLAADDILLPNRIARQVERFLSLPGYYGVVFSNAAYIDERGQQTSYHYPIGPDGRSSEHVPTGDVFREVLSRYFINTPTMMMRRDMLTALGGYDETLSFEDFDFWVRSSRTYRYAYIDEVLTQKRRLPNSLGAQVVWRNNPILESTYRVCQKALLLCQNIDEREALANRIRQFIRKSFYTEQYELARRFGKLLIQLEPLDLFTKGLLLLCRLRLPVNTVYRRYRLANS
jgi:glycosyltransferase involved in cell wall biosynthesis